MRLKKYGMKLVCKPRSIMGACIGLHGLMTDKDIRWWDCLPQGSDRKIPKNELWIREDHCKKGKILDEPIEVHEDVELLLMKEYELPYNIAHPIAEIAEARWKRHKKRLP